MLTLFATAGQSANFPVKKIILILSGSGDEGSDTPFKDISKLGKDTKIPIFAVRIPSNDNVQDDSVSKECVRINQLSHLSVGTYIESNQPEIILNSFNDNRLRLETGYEITWKTPFCFSKIWGLSTAPPKTASPLMEKSASKLAIKSESESETHCFESVAHCRYETKYQSQICYNTIKKDAFASLFVYHDVKEGLSYVFFSNISDYH